MPILPSNAKAKHGESPRSPDARAAHAKMRRDRDEIRKVAQRLAETLRAAAEYGRAPTRSTGPAAGGSMSGWRMSDDKPRKAWGAGRVALVARLDTIRSEMGQDLPLTAIYDRHRRN
jgi:hypothetical protein